MSFSPTYPFDLPELPPKIGCNNETFTEWLIKARAEMAELKGYSFSLPNPMLLLNPAIIKESVESSGIENINTTVEKVLEQQLFPEKDQKSEDKEVLRYKDAIIWGFENMDNFSIGNRLINGIHEKLLREKSYGLRVMQNHIENTLHHKILYTPPAANEIPRLITNWENYLHDETDRTDPLIKCAISHYQFEAIHPFSDGNGRTGRILMVLYLVKQKILNYPIIFISGYINQNRNEYYRLLQEVTTNKNWCPFIEYMLKGFYLQAKSTKDQFVKFMLLFLRYKKEIKTKCPNYYSFDLVEAIFAVPVITPVRLSSILGIHRTTATAYLKKLKDEGYLEHQPFGKYQLYINTELIKLLRGN